MRRCPKTEYQQEIDQELARTDIEAISAREATTNPMAIDVAR